MQGDMPTYEYQCMACKKRWEQFQPMMANPVKKCPRCGKSKAQRLLSAGAGFLFKGNGFHTTDYRSESYKKSASADKKPAAVTAKDSGAAKAGKSPGKK